MHTETIVETKNCKVCNTEFSITDKDLAFYKKVSPSFNGEKFTIPSPTCCPSCRQRRRLAFRNERKLYTRKCDATGKNIISIYSPEYTGKVYDQKFWRSDKRDALDYGRDFDFNRTFSKQFEELMQDAPHLSLLGLQNENSIYTNQSAFNKDCYLSFHILNSEHCLYSHQITDSKYCNNVLKGFNSQHCYNCVNIDNCFSCVNLINGINCNECYSSSNLVGCKYCILCENLENAEYVIKNKPVTKEEFNSYLSTYRKNYTLDSFLDYEKNPLNIVSCEDSEGIDLKYCKNIHHSFDVSYSEDGKYCDHLTKMNDKNTDIYDISFFGEDYHQGYEGVSVGACSSRLLFCNSVWRNCSSVYYSMFCFNNCKNLFGCVGLKNKEYCIFNKQYTKEEYNEIVPKIIKKMQEDGEWGEFFDPSLSPFGYNETVAMEYYPLTKEETLKLGFNWSDYEAPFPKVDKIVEGSKLWTSSCDIIHEQKPELLEKILNYAIKCEVSGKLFRLVKQEIEFYIKHKLPLPRKHPDIRHQERLALRGGKKV